MGLRCPQRANPTLANLRATEVKRPLAPVSLTVGKGSWVTFRPEADGRSYLMAPDGLPRGCAAEVGVCTAMLGCTLAWFSPAAQGGLNPSERGGPEGYGGKPSRETPPAKGNRNSCGVVCGYPQK